MLISKNTTTCIRPTVHPLQRQSPLPIRRHSSGTKRQTSNDVEVLAGIDQNNSHHVDHLYNSMRIMGRIARVIRRLHNRITKSHKTKRNSAARQQKIMLILNHLQRFSRTFRSRKCNSRHLRLMNLRRHRSTFKVKVTRRCLNIIRSNNRPIVRPTPNIRRQDYSRNSHTRANQRYIRRYYCQIR